MRKTTTNDRPMTSTAKPVKKPTPRTRVDLSLTDSEARTLLSVLMNTVYWAGSGQFGEDAKQIYTALTKEGYTEAAMRIQVPYTDLKGQRTWIPSRGL